MTDVRITHSATANGTGQLRASALKALLKSVPDNALVTLKTFAGDQREGSSWTLTANWTDADVPTGIMIPSGTSVYAKREGHLFNE